MERQPTMGMVINHGHEDGRQCILNPNEFWEFTCHRGCQHLCSREHPVAIKRKVNIDGPEPVRVSPGGPRDMMEGHPGVGKAYEPPITWTPSPSQVNPIRCEDDEQEAVVQMDPYGEPLDDGITLEITHAGITMKWTGQETGQFIEAATDDARYILANVLPDLLESFLRSNAKYARAQVHDLGIKGIVPDVNRKSSVIIDRLWHGAPTVGEDTHEVIDDLIGHLLLMRAKMRGE